LVIRQETLAVLAAVCGVAMGLAPLLQASRVMRRRRADDVSAGWLVVIVGGASAWAAYGISLDNWALIVPNTVGVVAAAVTLAAVLRVRRRSHQPTRP
jgi:uncharacterized protein with PQ loop repeat